MAKRAKPLTTRQVQAANRPGFYSDGNNLYLRVGPFGAKNWIFRYAFNQRRRDMGLGPVGIVTLAQAREKAIDLRRQLLARIDPIDHRRAARDDTLVAAAKGMTFRQAAEAYIAAHRAGWRNARHAEEWPRSLERFAFPIFGDISVGAIDTNLVMKALEPAWNQAPESASRVRGRIESILNWARARDYRNGENPARWRGHLENLLPNRRRIAPVQHLPALPYTEVAGFMGKLAKDEESMATKALMFTILTATRSSEVIGAKWDEFNLDERLWTIPSERMKAGREHRVPLSGAALALLNKIAETRYSDFVFAGHEVGQALGKGALAVAMKRAAGDQVMTVHGFRSCFRDWCAELTHFPAEVVEMALGHQVSSAVEGAYRRGDMFERRRKLAEAWARYCTAPASPVPLRVTKLRA